MTRLQKLFCNTLLPSITATLLMQVYALPASASPLTDCQAVCSKAGYPQSICFFWKNPPYYACMAACATVKIQGCEVALTKCEQMIARGHKTSGEICLATYNEMCGPTGDSPALAPAPNPAGTDALLNAFADSANACIDPSQVVDLGGGVNFCEETQPVTEKPVCVAPPDGSAN